MNENQKKQIPLRLSPKLYNAIAAWAEDDFRSVNGQIEYLLSECVRQTKIVFRPRGDRVIKLRGKAKGDLFFLFFTH